MLQFDFPPADFPVAFTLFRIFIIIFLTYTERNFIKKTFNKIVRAMLLEAVAGIGCGRSWKQFLRNWRDLNHHVEQ
jgi:hypothetical protein